jgi:hypothetical protein
MKNQGKEINPKKTKRVPVPMWNPGYCRLKLIELSGEYQ